MSKSDKFAYDPNDPKEGAVRFLGIVFIIDEPEGDDPRQHNASQTYVELKCVQRPFVINRLTRSQGRGWMCYGKNEEDAAGLANFLNRNGWKVEYKSGKVR